MQFNDDTVLARKRLDELFQGSPELFPVGFSEGYAFNGHTQISVKLNLSYRRIYLTTYGDAVTIIQGFVMPFQTARTKGVEDALLILRFNVHFWGLTHIYARNDMY